MRYAYSRSTWLFLAYVLLTFYCLGAAIFNELAEYRSWADTSAYLSAADVAAWQMATPEDNATLLFNVPYLLLTALVLALFRFLPTSVPRAALWAVLACHVAVWGLLLLARLPLQAELSPTLLSLLVYSDLVRKLTLVVEAFLAAYMAYRAFWPGHDNLPRPTMRKTPALG
ncbi:hypothetical protein GCM10027048_24540 [Hymenobacter coalescens]